MTQHRTAPARRRWGLLVTVALLAPALAAVLGFVALLSGSEFAAGEPSSAAQSVVLWVAAGLCLAAPVAALPSLGFGAGRRIAWLSAAAVAAAVALIGVLVLTQA